MLLPLVADGIATIVTCNIYCRCHCQGGIDVIATRVVFWCIGRWNGQYQHYSNLSSEMLCRTSSHICGRWYLPMFLFRDGLFDSYVESLFNCSQEVLILSSHYTEVVNSDTVTRDDRMVIDGGRGLEMFLEPLCKISC